MRINKEQKEGVARVLDGLTVAAIIAAVVAASIVAPIQYLHSIIIGIANDQSVVLLVVCHTPRLVEFILPAASLYVHKNRYQIAPFEDWGKLSISQSE